ncbi:MAG: HAMP domain-containing protein [Cyanothece sp. SIO2G6]|nr:HAMP domain-containing protein [Cyanothece sp. SIO2G6]
MIEPSATPEDVAAHERTVNPNINRPNINRSGTSRSGTNNQWWVFTIPIGFGSRHNGPTFPVLLLATGIGIWLLSVWATRRITDPLLHFAAAADRLGMDVNAPPLPEHGSKELRQAAQAFNQMQERLQRLIGDRTFMLAAISHDLRTVLTRLRLRAEFIDNPVQQQKAAADLTQMEMMLTSTLNFAKEDSAPEPRTTLDLASLLQSICDDLTDAGYQTLCEPHPRVSIPGQPTALRRALTNLVENAAIYGQEATVTLSVLSSGVEVMISDRGPGIPPEMRENVFKPFFRLEQSRNRETGGTGLGLAVARTVIRRHGGEIRLQDRWPHGYNQPDGKGQGGPGLVVAVYLPSD